MLVNFIWKFLKSKIALSIIYEAMLFVIPVIVNIFGQIYQKVLNV